MFRKLVALAVLAIAAPAFAQEPVGCDKFKWPLDHEKALLASPAQVASGGEASQALGAAIKLALVPLADAKLPIEPSPKPKSPDSYAGFVRLPALPMAGTYRVTLSEGGWIDVFQEGREVKSGAFSGATGCEGIRKSVKFDLSAAPLVIEVTGTTAREIGIVVTPD
jgi:hypothetical protein